MPDARDFTQVAPGEGKTIHLFGVRFDYKIESVDSGGALSVLEIQVPPKTLIKPHTHTREDEFSIVLSGTLGARIGDRVLEAGPGTYLSKPRNTPHAMWNATDTPATVVEMLAPGGLEAYFEELAPILERHEPPERYYGLAEQYGLTINDDWIPELEQAYGVRL